jgi:hypothetical protein
MMFIGLMHTYERKIYSYWWSHAYERKINSYWWSHAYEQKINSYWWSHAYEQKINSYWWSHAYEWQINSYWWSPLRAVSCSGDHQQELIFVFVRALCGVLFMKWPSYFVSVSYYLSLVILPLYNFPAHSTVPAVRRCGHST